MIRYNYRNVSVDGADIVNQLSTGEFVGIIEHMPSDVYHGLKSYFSSSDLKAIYRSSPYHFKVERDADKWNEPTANMILGSVVHCLLLTPDEFEFEYYVMDKVDRRTKAGALATEKALSERGKRQIVFASVVDKARDIVDSFSSSSLVNELLAGAQRELSYFWKCPFSGLNFRARADGLGLDYLIEVKTAISAKPSDFERQSFNLHYDLSAFHYAEGLRALTGDEINNIYFFVAENEEPYGMQTFCTTAEFMISGNNKWLDAVTKLEKAEESGYWPMYSMANQVMPLSVPRWAISSEMIGEDE